MSYDSERSGAGVWIAIAVALIVVVFGCLLVAGAGVFWLRSSAMAQQEAMIVREQVLRDRALVQAQAQQLAEEIKIEDELPAASALTIALDGEGNLQLEGVATDLEQLRLDLNEQVQNTDVGSVIILPAADTKLEDVTKVFSLCMEAGVTDIQMRRSP